MALMMWGSKDRGKGKEGRMVAGREREGRKGAIEKALGEGRPGEGQGELQCGAGRRRRLQISSNMRKDDQGMCGAHVPCLRQSHALCPFIVRIQCTTTASS